MAVAAAVSEVAELFTSTLPHVPEASADPHAAPIQPHAAHTAPCSPHAAPYSPHAAPYSPHAACIYPRSYCARCAPSRTSTRPRSPTWRWRGCCISWAMVAVRPPQSHRVVPAAAAWVASGCSLGCVWLQPGLPLVTAWVAYGYSLGCLWLQPGPPMVTGWVILGVRDASHLEEHIALRWAPIFSPWPMRSSLLAHRPQVVDSSGGSSGVAVAHRPQCNNRQPRLCP